MSAHSGLSARSVVTAGLTCRRWHDATEAEHVWREMCHRSFPGTGSLAGVTSYKKLYARLAYPRGSPHRRHPQLEEYQFLVRISEGATILLDTCLSGSDCVAVERRPWMTSMEHRFVAWRVMLLPVAVPKAAMESREALVEFLDALAKRDENCWRTSVTAFRAAVQRCQLLLNSGTGVRTCRPERVHHDTQ